VHGITPDHFKNGHAEQSFNLIEEQCTPTLNDGLPLLSHLIIDHRGMPYAILEGLYVVFCLFSSYLYGYLACFKTGKTGNYYIMFISFESFFLLKVISQFFVTYDNPS